MIIQPLFIKIHKIPVLLALFATNRQEKKPGVSDVHKIFI